MWISPLPGLDEVSGKGEEDVGIERCRGSFYMTGFKLEATSAS